MHLQINGLLALSRMLVNAWSEWSHVLILACLTHHGWNCILMLDGMNENPLYLLGTHTLWLKHLDEIH